LRWAFWDVKGEFQNTRGEEELKKSEEGRQWIPWVRRFFRAREFQLEWGGRVREEGRMNTGAAQGSPLSPVIFLIWMAPIITRMGEALNEQFLHVEIEIPSYVDDLHGGICIWDKNFTKGCDMEAMLQRVDETVNRVAAENHLPLEDSKHERLVLRDRRRG